MEKKKVVIALGHRAMGTTLPEQKLAARSTAKKIVKLVKEGAEIVITHGNTPQLGMIHTAMNEFGIAHPEYTCAPMSVCSAMSQGYIGFDLQNAIRAELLKEGIYKPVCTVITQVVVDPYDDAFAEPVKKIGRNLTEREAGDEEEKGNYVIKENDHYRRIVAAPKPCKIVEIDSIRALLDAGNIVIACGGGGVPVLEQKTELKGASAVIEKDYASGVMAEALDADELLILTSVNNVVVNYGTEEETLLETITAEEAERYISDGHFEETTMLPKMEASVSFVEKRDGRMAVITSIDNAYEGYIGKEGTIIK